MVKEVMVETTQDLNNWKKFGEALPPVGKKVTIRIRDEDIHHFGRAIFDGKDFRMNGGTVKSKYISHFIA